MPEFSGTTIGVSGEQYNIVEVAVAVIRCEIGDIGTFSLRGSQRCASDPPPGGAPGIIQIKRPTRFFA